MTEKPLKEHYEVDSDAGIMVRTFDYIADLEKYCTSIEKDLLSKIARIQMLDNNFVEYMQGFEAHRDKLNAELAAKDARIKELEEAIESFNRSEHNLRESIHSRDKTIKELEEQVIVLENELARGEF
jgi:chromosome segregation ATPase